MGAVGIKNIFNYLWKKKFCLFRKKKKKVFSKPLQEIISLYDEHDVVVFPETQFLLDNVLKFHYLRVEDVMTPRADIEAVEDKITLEELVVQFSRTPYSCLPVYKDTLDNPIGLVRAKDVMPLLSQRNENVVSWLDIRRDVIYVPVSMPVLDLLLRMRATRIGVALVVDEYGGTDGLVTIGDLTEKIMGEVSSDDDLLSLELVEKSVGVYDASARLPICDLEKELGVIFEREEGIDTLGGLLFSRTGRVPERGEIITCDSGVEFEIIEMDARRIKLLRIYFNNFREL